MKRLLLPLLPLLAASAVQAADWPHWRGSARTGISTETVPESFAGNGPKELWKAQVGVGFSSFAVASGKVYTLGHADDQDTVFCLDAKTGKEVWKHSYAAELGDKYYEGGPSSTPTVDGAQVFTLSKWGDVFSFDAATGKIAWQKNIAEEIGAGIPDWGFAGSPLVHGDKVILNVGAAGVALNKADGKIVWKSEGDAPAGYSTPLPIKASGQDLVILATKEAYTALAPDTGKIAWAIPWETRYYVNAADPIPADGKLFISTGYGKGCGLFDISSAEPQQVYQNRDMRNQMSPSVLIGGHLYGIDGDERANTMLKCVEMATGRVKWSEPVAKAGALTATQDKLIILSGTGELTIAKASPDGYDPLASAQVQTGRCWSTPVLSNGQLYTRNAEGEVVCLSMD